MQKMQIGMSSRKSQEPNETNFNCNHNKCGTFVLKRQQQRQQQNIRRSQAAAELALYVPLLINYAHTGIHPVV